MGLSDLEGREKGLLGRQIEAASQGGPGGHSARAESGVTSVREQRLTGLAIRRGWITGQRWATDATVEELVELQKQRPLTVRERTMIAIARDVVHEDPRVRQIAVRNSVAVEAQNQTDERDAAGLSEGTNVNVNVTGIAIETRADFYGTAEAAPAEADGARGQSAGVSGSVQDGSVRPTLGQDGDGADDDSGGARTETGRLEGGD